MDKISEMKINTTMKLKDVYSVLSENKFNLLFNTLVLVFLNMYSEGVVSNLMDITMVYATLASIIISVTFLIVQLSSSTYGSEIWKTYKNDRYVQYYLVTTPFLVLVGLILVISSSAYVTWLNINLLPIFLMFFSIFLIPTYFLHLMDTLKPENILNNILTSIDKKELNSYNNSKSKYNSAEEIQTYSIDMIANIFKILAKQEQYNAVKNCMDLLSGKYFEELFKKYEYSELDIFLNQYTVLIRTIGTKDYPPESDYKIKVSAITSLEKIATTLIQNDKDIALQILSISNIFVKKMKKYDSYQFLNNEYDYLPQYSLDRVVETSINSLNTIKLKLLESTFNNSESAKNRVPYLFQHLTEIAVYLIYGIGESVEYNQKRTDDTLRFLGFDLGFITKVINSINEKSFEYIEQSTNEKEVSFLINSIIESYYQIMFTKYYNLKEDSKLIFENEQTLMAESICRLINLLESKGYIRYIEHILEKINEISSESDYINQLFYDSTYIGLYELNVKLNSMEFFKNIWDMLKNGNKGVFSLLMIIWGWDSQFYKGKLLRSEYLIDKKNLETILSDEYFKKWISENKYENRIEEIKKVLSNFNEVIVKQ